VAGFGIKVTLIEHGPYATDFGSQSSLKIAAGRDAYAGIRAQLFAHGAQIEFGEPQATLPAVLKIVDAEHPPLRAVFYRGLFAKRCRPGMLSPATSVAGKPRKASGWTKSELGDQGDMETRRGWEYAVATESASWRTHVQRAWSL
jgi:hypothetical protein